MQSASRSREVLAEPTVVLKEVWVGLSYIH